MFGSCLFVSFGADATKLSCCGRCWRPMLTGVVATYACQGRCGAANLHAPESGPGDMQLWCDSTLHDGHRTCVLLLNLKSETVRASSSGILCRFSAGNDGILPINHPLWFPLRESLGSLPNFGSFPAEHQQVCLACM